MKDALFRVKTTNARHLEDDEFVEEVMDQLMKDYPQVKGYTYERVDGDHIHILMWGDIELIEE